MFKFSAIVLYTLSGALSILDFFLNCQILFYCTRSEIFYILTCTKIQNLAARAIKKLSNNFKRNPKYSLRPIEDRKQLLKIGRLYLM